MKKIILTLVAFCFLFSDAAGQEIEWQNTIGGGGEDELFSVQQTSDGGYILGGSSNSDISGDKTENTNGAEDYWIVKTDATGNIQWQNSIGGSSADVLICVRQTTDGGYILGGYSASNISGDKTENCLGGFSDYWIVKTDAGGNIQWQNTIGGSNPDLLYSIEQTSDGGYILGGNSNSDISGDKTENCIGNNDYWIVKTDATGNIQWQNTIGGNGTEELWSIKQTSDGGYILGGWSNSDISGDKTENNIGLGDYWIVKTDITGNIQWQNTIGGTGGDVLYSLQQTTDGGYILGGSSNSDISGDKTEGTIGLYGFDDYWLVKTDVSGTIQWQNTIGGNEQDIPQTILQTVDGGYALGGYSYSNISGDKTESCNGDWDFWIVKTDSGGNIQWQNTIGGNGDDEIWTMQQTSDGGFILGGMSSSDLSGDKSENSNFHFDYWIIKLTDKFNTITGKIFIDSNSNGIQDAGETDVTSQNIAELNTGKIALSQQNGAYDLVVPDSGNFAVSTSAYYYNILPATNSAYFSSFHQTDSLNDFAFQPSGVFNDLCVTINPMGNFRAGFNASYIINYENVGTTTLSGTVIFFPDNDITFVSSDVTPTLVTTDSIIWNIGTLTPYQTGNILIIVHVNAGTPIGTLINSMVKIEPIQGDANTECNTNVFNVYVTGAVDPNAILVDRDTVFTTELSSPHYLNYIIYFQNTGNDTAFNARVLNNIPQMLDVNSFEFVASSHPVNINYGAHARLMEFTFDNILLPDSNVNEPASHGFIRYRIKPKATLVAGDSIESTAYIYFDFNQPVVTNTAVTEIVLPTGEEEFKVQSLKFKVFPNPVRDELIVSSYSIPGKTAEVIIYDLFGRKVYQKQLETLDFKLETKINVSGFSQGIYLIQLKSGEKTARAKFVKQ